VVTISYIFILPQITTPWGELVDRFNEFKQARALSVIIYDPADKLDDDKFGSTRSFWSPFDLLRDDIVFRFTMINGSGGEDQMNHD
jgi:hypothetical protein